MADNRALFGDKKIEKELKTTLDDLLALASNNKKENEGNAKYEKSKNIAKPKTQMKNVNPLTVETYDNQHRKTINSTKKQHRIYDTTVQVSRDELKTQKPPEAVRRSKSVVRDIYNTSEISINNTPDDEVDDDSFQESELSIEEMVANAVVSKKSSKSRFVERTATEEDAIPDEELTRILDAEGTLDEYL
ncbi:MAG: hypothetical protein GX896_06755, partial [Clostridiales bacterium]|nr:hypothetical protein [Clostridiales bacterium]